ncbi:MAG: hypothetical protein SGJ05_02225 [bacterium]|nr:hypothetical protein [bacterium]
MLNIADGSTDSVFHFDLGAKSQNVYVEILPQIHCVAIIATRTYRLYSYPQWQVIKEIMMPGNFPAAGLAVTPDGSTILFQNTDVRLFVINAETGDVIRQGLSFAYLAMSADGRRMATSETLDKSTTIRDVETRHRDCLVAHICCDS